MEAELNKFTLNGLAAFVSPGAIILLFVLWGVAILFPHQPNYFKDYEVLSVFMFITVAYLAGSFINTLGVWAEKKLLMRNKYNPRLKALEGRYFWVEDLDKLYFTSTGIHIYDYTKNGEAKAGDVNGKKIDQYNLSQFERFAGFYLKKHALNESVDMAKEKYLLFRNLGVSFFICAKLTIAYIIINFFKPVFSAGAPDIFYNLWFVITIVGLLAILGIILLLSAKKQRVAYLQDLYRMVRYHYLSPANT